MHLQLGQLSVNPPRLLLEVGGDFNLAGSHAWRAEVPPTWNLEVGGDFNFTGIAACKVEVPPRFKHKSGGDHAELT